MQKRHVKRLVHLAICAVTLLSVALGAFNGRYEPTALAQTYGGGSGSYYCVSPPAGCNPIGCTNRPSPEGTIWVCQWMFTTGCPDKRCEKRDW